MKTKTILLCLLCLTTGAFSQSKTTKVEIIDGYVIKTLKAKIEKNVSGLLDDISKCYNSNSEKVFFSQCGVSENAKESINMIWASSKFYCPKAEIKERLLKTSSGFEIRNIPLMLDTLREEVVLEIDREGEITDMYFAVNQHQYKNILPGNVVVSETRQNIIRDFLESLKTAYIKKDADFINMVLSDKALIVVGKSVKQTDKNSFKVSDSGKQTLYNNDPVNSVYKKMTKKEYMDGLRKVFSANKNILVNFEDIEMIPHRKSGYESFYGVRLKQKWQADNYSDYGLLFFVIQFRENDYPLIWVRVWQDANTTTSADQIGLGEIQIQPN